jgi:hypothetical protein
VPNVPKPKPYSEEDFKKDADKFIKGYLGGFDQGEMNQFLKNSISKIENSGVMSSDEAKDFIKERASYLRQFAKDNPGETLPQLKADGGRIGYSEGSDDYFDEQKTNVKGKKTTGPVKGGKTPEIPPEEFQKYLKYKKNKVVKAATGGRIGYNQGSLEPDTMALKEKIEEIMDIEGVGFGEAFKQAMRELASQSKE